MRILVVSRHYPLPLDRGSNLRVYPILKYLAQRHEVSLVTFAREGGDPAPMLDLLRRVCGRVTVVEEEDGRIGRHLPAMQSAVDDAVAAAAPDVLLAEWLYAAPYALAHPGLPRVLDEHNAEAAASARAARLEPASWPRRLRRRLSDARLAAFERRMVRAFDHVTSVSDVDRGHLVALGADPDRVTTVPNSIDLDTLATAPTARVPDRLVYPGSLTYGPNLDACLVFATTVLPRIRRSRPGATLVITGSLPASIPSSLRSAPGVELAGRVADVHAVIRSAEAVVVPLRTAGGTRLKILEAFALGTPVVSTAVGAEGLAVEPGRELLVADRPDAFAAAVLRLLAEPGEGRRLAAAAARLVEQRYSWAANIRLLEAALEAAQGRRAPAGRAA